MTLKISSNNFEICNRHKLNKLHILIAAPGLEEWSFCPITGGFDFRTYMYDRRQVGLKFNMIHIISIK